MDKSWFTFTETSANAGDALWTVSLLFNLFNRLLSVKKEREKTKSACFVLNSLLV